ncbi:FkbM family methyltransferase [Akkermansiaceae bacterium]|nr:FkbM family methyltransferase [Akkermansiaceae bacterium]MDA7936193.1 FkbM family methyltransferase [bacterium]MDC1205956.1 FkbM family methyltransferase [Akkermansiaceae bacterium]
MPIQSFFQTYNKVMSILRDLIFKLRYGFRGYPVTISGTPFRVDESLRRWNMDCEESLHAKLRELVKAGDTVVDIGANFGLHTLYAAHLTTPAGRVYAFEPVPKNLALLHRNLGLNNLADQVVVEDAAVSNSPDSHLEIFCPEEEVSVTASLSSDAGGATALKVRNLRLDDYTFDVSRAPTLVKIDVEGAEYEVLQGAEQFLLSAKPTLLIEVHVYALEDFGTSLEDFEGFLTKLGYQGERLSASGVEREDYYQMIYIPTPS